MSKIFFSRWIACGAVLLSATMAYAQPRVPTTKTDFYFHGSQPTTPNTNNFQGLAESGICASCHGDYEESHSPYERWRYSMMAQAYRDPVYHAAMQIAEKDAAGVSDLCMRCHTPLGWLQNRATTLNGSSLFPTDSEGVSCSICHRAVDPDYKPGISPSIDLPILQALGVNRPPTTGQGGALSYSHLVVDNEDRRRGPFNLGQFFFHEWVESPLHRTSDLCASCHDVSNPAYSKMPDGSYQANALNTQHPTGNKYDMFPIERLWSEWKQSAYGSGLVTQIVDGAGRFGGYQVTAYQNCQDCHMPAVKGTGCAPFLGPPERNNVPQHNFAGANSWVLRAVNDLFDSNATYMEDPMRIDESIQRSATLMQRASDLEVLNISDKLKVRIINESGHKLPSGYAEGRRMWINVKFYNASNQLIAERGAYNGATGDLSEGDTKVYEQKQGLDASASLLTGLPQGESFHFALNNQITKDNRIPPRGFTNAAFAAIQCAPVGTTYADGQHWDDTYFVVPAGTASAVVNVFHQTSSKEYIEFLRDNANTPIAPADFIQPPANSTATTIGQVVHEQWVKWGRSAPTLMDNTTAAARACKPDIGMMGAVPGADGLLNNDDFIVFIDMFFNQDPIADMGVQGGIPGADSAFDNNDFVVFIDLFFGACS